MDQKEQDHFSGSEMKRYARISLLVSVILFAVLILLQNNYFNSSYSERDIQRFEKVLHAKEKRVADEFEWVKEQARDGDILSVLNKRSGFYKNLAEEKGIFLFYYENDIMVYWSDHTVPIDVVWNPGERNRFIELQNAAYLSVNEETEQGILYGLIEIRTTFPYENEYLTNSFQPDFKIDPGVIVTNQHDDHFFAINSSNGEFVFSLDMSENPQKNVQNIRWALLCFVFSVLALFSFLFWMVKKARTYRVRTSWLLASFLILVLLFIIVFQFEIPRIIFLSGLFQPDIFANLTFSSLGNLWAFVLFVMFIVILFYRFFGRSEEIPKRYYPYLSLVIFLAASAWYLVLHHILSALVLDSNISFEAFKLKSLDIYSFIGLLILALAFVSLCLIIDLGIRYSKGSIRWRYISILISIVLLQVPFMYADSLNIEWITPLFYILFILSILYVRRDNVKTMRFSGFFFPVIFFALFSTIELQDHSSIKIESQKEIELVKLSSERDVVAEMLFSEISETLKRDSILMGRLSFSYLNIDFIYDYLQRNYFSGYWTKYDLQITLCGEQDSVYVESPVDAWYYCYGFFDDVVLSEGMEVPQSDFYFLNNLNARISYMGVIRYDIEGSELSLYIELDSKIISEELGYPELLIRRESSEKVPFSYARYNQGKLITNGGEFDYRLTPDLYTRKEATFEKTRQNGYNHSVLNVDADNTVIVSTPVVSFVDILISFSYIFAFYFILLSISFLAISSPRLRSTLVWNFKNKIQYSMIGILFLTFVFICAGTIYFIVEQYQTKHHNNLQNTMRSVYIELVHKVEFEEDLRNWSSESYYNLDELLRKFSNVFYTDINMYDEQGFLLASSRSEIFNQELLSIRMDRDAYEKLAMENYSAFINTERIGNLSYQSAYVPLLNSENQFLAYLNLPYFTQPEVLAKEVTNLVVAILNIYVILLILILFLSVFLADRITQPLRVIQNRIAQLSFSKSNEKIVYKGRDEIQGLVDEYNFMIDELGRSADLLAQSERETAWREMAKQIAHEIKNPLTPMKLNVQHLQRMISEGDKNVNEQIEKMSSALIEQIDSLSSIANEFSDFAKMPKAKNQKIDLTERLNTTVQLFQNNEKAMVKLDVTDAEKITVFGDPEQLQRLIINLVKNGIQAIPERRKGVIRIQAGITRDGNAMIKVTDNGKGIPDDIQDKLFQPNFTTKGSGMGMGLAIAASIVTSMNGKIWYETELGSGTTFFVLLPVMASRT